MLKSHVPVLLALIAASGFAQQAPTGPSTALQARVAPPARITKFAASAESIQPGQAVMLTWAVENPAGLTLDPGIGRVTPRGTKQVFPAATTTYTLTVRGPNNTSVVQSVTVNVTGATATSS